MKIDPAIWWGVGLGGAALVALAVAQGKINLGAKTSGIGGTGNTGNSETGSKPDDIRFVVDPRESTCPPGKICTTNTTSTVVTSPTGGKTVVADPAVAVSTSGSAAATTAPPNPFRGLEAAAADLRGMRSILNDIWDTATPNRQPPNENSKSTLGKWIGRMLWDAASIAAMSDPTSCNLSGGVRCDETANRPEVLEAKRLIAELQKWIKDNGLENDPAFTGGLKNHMDSYDVCKEWSPPPTWQGISPELQAIQRREWDERRRLLGCASAGTSASKFDVRVPTVLNPVDRIIFVDEPVAPPPRFTVTPLPIKTPEIPRPIAFVDEDPIPTIEVINQENKRRIGTVIGVIGRM